MLSVVTWKWTTPGYHSQFTASHVNTLARMVGRHYAKPHRILCVTDDPFGIDRAVEIVPMLSVFGDLMNPHGPAYPSCYRRLLMFSPWASETLGRRFVSLDLDCVVTGDLSPLFDCSADFAMWKDPLNTGQYNPSLLLMTAGARPQVWDDFDPARSPAAARAAGFKGSDQAWISHRLGRDERTFDPADGVYSYRAHLKGKRELPANARLVVFHGAVDPWDDEAQQLPWVKAQWQ